MELSFDNIIKKGANAIVIQGISILITLILNWYLAIELGSKEYGVFTYAFSWVYLFGTLSMLGLNSVAQREIIKILPEKVKGLIRFSRKTTFLLSITTTAIFSGIIYWCLPELDDDLMQSLLLAIVALPLFSQLMLNKSISIGLKKVEHSLLPEDVVRPLITLLGCLLVWNFIPASTHSIILINIGAIVTALLISILFVQKATPLAKERASENKKWLKLGTTFFILTATVTINAKADILMLGFYGFTDKVGIYNIAVKFSVFIGMPLMLTNKVLIPYISKFFETETKKLNDIIKKVTRIIFFIGTLIALFYYFVGNEILTLFGEDFSLAYWSLLILSVGQLLNVFVGPVGNILSMSKHEKISLKVMIISTLINIILNITLIPIYNINGAAIATCISLLFWNIALLIAVKQKLKINPSVI